MKLNLSIQSLINPLINPFKKVYTMIIGHDSTIQATLATSKRQEQRAASMRKCGERVHFIKDSTPLRQPIIQISL